MSISEEKRALRAHFKSIRAELRSASLSAEICKRCAELPFLERADTVLLYAKMGSEADILPLLDALTAKGKRVCLPRCVSSEDMDFHHVIDTSELTLGRYGIREPLASLPVVDVGDMGKDAVCFVPALAYDRGGYRLGYGAGYYDRFLSRFSGRTVGVTFEACFVSRLPRGEHDKNTEYIITESRVTKGIED